MKNIIINREDALEVLTTEEAMILDVLISKVQNHTENKKVEEKFHTSQQEQAAMFLHIIEALSPIVRQTAHNQVFNIVEDIMVSKMMEEQQTALETIMKNNPNKNW